MKLNKLIITILILTLFSISCSKDDATPVTQSTPNYTPFGYFQGSINFLPISADNTLKLIFVFEKDNKLLVGFNVTTLTASNSASLLNGSYTVEGNKILGTFTNPNAIPSITYNFIGDFDPKTAKYTATFTGIGTNVSSSGTIVLEKVL